MKFQLLALIFFVCSCTVHHSNPPDRLVILNWNLKNLFDAKEDGGEYPEFNPSRGYYHQGIYEQRIENLASAIQTLSPAPNILVLQEVENRVVLEDLARSIDWKQSWVWLSPGENPTSPGILSQIPPTSRGFIDPSQGRRILEVGYFHGPREIRIWNNHWKSRHPDPVSTEPLRFLSSQFLTFRLKNLFLITGESKQWMVMGDFNAWPEDPTSINLGTFQQLLEYPFSPSSEPWLREAKLPNHTYFFRDSAYPLDHLFLTDDFYDGENWDLKSIHIPVCAPFVKGERPRPWSWEDRDGLSDHLPMLITLEWKAFSNAPGL